MSARIHAGDLAEYVGPVKRLAGARLEVDSLTPKRTRVRCVIRLANGCTAMRLFKPENLKRLGGG